MGGLNEAYGVKLAIFPGTKTSHEAADIGLLLTPDLFQILIGTHDDDEGGERMEGFREMSDGRQSRRRRGKEAESRAEQEDFP